MSSDSRSTAVVAPKRLLRLRSDTSATGRSIMKSSLERAPRISIEKRQPIRLKGKSDLFAGADFRRRWQTRAQLAVGRRNRHDLGGAEILGTEHFSSNLGAVIEADML